jgi:hypothetical protein
MRILIKLILSIALIEGVYAQEQELESKEPPPYSLFRAEENYEYLKDQKSNPYQEDLFDAIKFIPLTKNKAAYLSFGGQFRPRFEYFSNRWWAPDDDIEFYSQRIALHSNLVLGKHIRIFGELYHGYISHEKEIAEYDVVNFHQAFLELSLPLKSHTDISIRLGRQEMAFGAGRLIGFREGPNIRRSFDAARMIYKQGQTNIQLFYGKEVFPLFEAFDNKFTFFDGDSPNPQLWGINSRFKIKGVTGMNEIYYFGFQSDNATFNDISGEEVRHSIGLRRFGKLGKRWFYNTEVIYQFGEIGHNDISAFDIESDWHYKLIHTPWQPNPGLKLQYTSGDKKAGDGKINTFNPMFVNPAYYSLALTITPINIISIHPSVSITPTEKLTLYTEWAFFWRASEKDGLYRPPRFINMPAAGNSEKSLGSQFGFKATYEINRHVSFDLDMSYFVKGNFQKASGESANIFHIAPTLSYKF